MKSDEQSNRLVTTFGEFQRILVGEGVASDSRLRELWINGVAALGYPTVAKVRDTAKFAKGEMGPKGASLDDMLEALCFMVQE